MIKKLAFALVSILVSACSVLMDYEPVKFKASGNRLIMTGVIDSDIKSKLVEALARNPQVDTLVMQYVEGSVDDEANLEAALWLRQQGLNTHVPGDGLIASGGVDFFLAGVQRTIDAGAKIGVHSWAGFGVDEASQLPKTHPEHQKYLSYYHKVGVPAEFYWFTLAAASASDIHWMSEKEQKKFHLRTP